MKLYEDKAVVDMLHHILREYPFLKYDEAGSKKALGNMLKVKVTDSNPKGSSIGRTIADELSKATGRNFVSPNTLNINRMKSFNILEMIER